MDVPLWLYTAIGTLICTGISAGANIGLAYVLYNRKEAETAMFAWPSTIAGDVAVTSIVGSIITWLIGTQLTLFDLSKTTPLNITGTDGMSKAVLPSFLHPLAEASYQSIPDKDIPSTLRNLVFVVFVGALLGVILVPTLGVIFILLGHYVVVTEDGWSMRELMLYKGIFGGIMGLLLQPLIVLLVATKPKAPIKHLEAEDAESEANSNPPTDDNLPPNP